MKLTKTTRPKQKEFPKGIIAVIIIALIAIPIAAAVIYSDQSKYQKPFFENIGSYVDADSTATVQLLTTATAYRVTLNTIDELQARIGSDLPIMNGTYAGKNTIIVKTTLAEPFLDMESGTVVYIILVSTSFPVDEARGYTGYGAVVLPASLYESTINTMVQMCQANKIPIATRL